MVCNIFIIFHSIGKQTKKTISKRCILAKLYYRRLPFPFFHIFATNIGKAVEKQRKKWYNDYRKHRFLINDKRNEVLKA